MFISMKQAVEGTIFVSWCSSRANSDDLVKSICNAPVAAPPLSASHSSCREGGRHALLSRGTDDDPNVWGSLLCYEIFHSKNTWNKPV